MEQGYHQMADNVQAIAGCNNVSGLNSFHQVDFSHPLPTKPVVLPRRHDNERMRTLRVKTKWIALPCRSKKARWYPYCRDYLFHAIEEWTGVDNHGRGSCHDQLLQRGVLFSRSLTAIHHGRHAERTRRGHCRSRHKPALSH